MPKDSITIRLQSDLIDSLEAEADEQSVSRSEYIRQILRQRHEVDELQEKVDTLQERLDSREDRVTELEKQLTERSRIEEKVDTLAKKEQESDAPFFIKWYWWYKSRDE